jgi:PAS domain S-box-containing protein
VTRGKTFIPSQLSGLYTVSRALRVLVVDDSDFFRTLVAGELDALYDMEIETAPGASEALGRLEAGSFDCIVSDYDMPGADGIDLFERLRARGDEVPFILLTAAGSEAVASEAITAGVTDYFAKAEGEEQFEILGKRIENVVSQRRAERDLQRQRRLHEDLWNVTEDLVYASTRDEIDRSVCRRLADIDQFAFAWIGDRDAVPRALAGADPADIQRVRESLHDGEGLSPAAVAVAERAVLSTEVECPPSSEGRAVEVATVPLGHREETYGLLGIGVIAEDGLGEGERDALAQLGSTVGHALAAVETEREVEIFREAVEQADPAIVITDNDGTIEYVNRAFEGVTGHSAESVEGTSLADLTGWDAERAETLHERVRGGEHVREETVQHREDGTQFHADLSVAPLRLDGEAVEKFVVIESDITNLKSREQRLQVFNRILRHNLRNDLNVVQGYLALLLERIEDAEARSHAEDAEAKLADLLSISEKVRSAARTIRTTREAEEPRVVDLGELLGREADRVRESAPEATVAVDADGNPAVRATNVDVAIRELLANAIEHNDGQDARVSIGVDQETAPDGFLAVEIADDGPGIPDLEREVLERGSETKLKHSRSLGLWLVNWIVTHAGGHLEIEDRPDGGTLVRLVLPRAGDGP